MPIVLKSGSLNLLEPSGPIQACNGIDLPFTGTLRFDVTNKKYCSYTWLNNNIIYYYYYYYYHHHHHHHHRCSSIPVRTRLLTAPVPRGLLLVYLGVRDCQAGGFSCSAGAVTASKDL